MLAINVLFCNENISMLKKTVKIDKKRLLKISFCDWREKIRESRINSRFFNRLANRCFFSLQNMVSTTDFKIKILEEEIKRQDMEILVLQQKLAHHVGNDEHKSRSSMQQVFPLAPPNTDYDTILDSLLNDVSDIPKEFLEEKEAWSSLFRNQYNTYRLSDEKKEKYWASRSKIVEFMFSWFMMRMKCQSALQASATSQAVSGALSPWL